MCPIPSRGGAIVAALFLVLCCGRAFAQATPAGAGRAYPVKPIRLIVPFPAGASTDIVGRMLGQKLFEQLGQQVVLRTETARYAEIVRSAGLPRE